MKQQLRITHVKLINHIVLGNIEFHLDNDIVSILGKNGSGKSFLIDTLQPFARSNRFVGSYPVVPNATGYKQIDFTTGDGTIYETIHEYVPKGKSHACKSYLNKIQKGIKLELNPTGHCEKYEELVKQHLNFDSNCMTIGFLSFKANGITSSRGQERKKILESTIDNPILKQFKKNAKELARDYTATAKHYEKQKIRVANQYTEESLLEDIDKLDSEITFKRAKYNTDKETLDNEIARLNELESKSKLNISDIKSVYDLSNNDGTVYESYQVYRDAVQSSERLSNEFLKLNDKIQRITRRNKLKDELEASESILKEKSEDLHKYQDILYKYVYEDKRKDIKPWLENMLRLAKYFTDTFKGLAVIATSSDNLDNIIATLVEQKKDNEDFMIRYRAALSNIDGNKYVVNVQDNCNSCQLYDKFIKSDEFVSDNKNKWDNVVNLEQPDIEDKLRKLTIVRENIKSSLISSIENASVFIKDLNKTGLTSVDSFLNECGTGVLYPKLMKFYEWVDENNGYIDKLEETITEITTRISYIKQELDSVSILEEMALNIAINKRDYIQSELTKYDKIITDSSYKAIGALDISNPDIFRYMNMETEQLGKLYNDVSNIERDLNECRNRVRRLEVETVDIPSKIERLLITKTQTEGKLNDLRTLNKNLVEYDRKGKILVRCKDLLDKDIPISLLRNNLQFIEKTTNAILINNSIQMGVNIIPSETEITIEVNVRDKTINDAIQLSSGETAIVSLLINACALHILGYPIICIDEMDANLDKIYRDKFSDLIYSIMSILQISQVFCISHNIATNINYATKILVGSEEGLDLNAYDCTSLIKL